MLTDVDLEYWYRRGIEDAEKGRGRLMSVRANGQIRYDRDPGTAFEEYSYEEEKVIARTYYNGYSAASREPQS